MQVKMQLKVIKNKLQIKYKYCTHNTVYVCAYYWGAPSLTYFWCEVKKLGHRGRDPCIETRHNIGARHDIVQNIHVICQEPLGDRGDREEQVSHGMNSLRVQLYSTMLEVFQSHTWNDLPDSLRLIDSLELFKSNLKTHLFKAAFVNYLWGIL